MGGNKDGSRVEQTQSALYGEGSKATHLGRGGSAARQDEHAGLFVHFLRSTPALAPGGRAMGMMDAHTHTGTPAAG
jgi:hypothetical protein